MHAIRVVPERQIDPNHRAFIPGLAEHVPGGVYLHEGEDVTGWTVGDVTISIHHGAPPIFTFDYLTDPVGPSTGSYKVRVNLFRRSAGWKWDTDSPGFNAATLSTIETLISVEARGKHQYALRVDVDDLHLERYPDAKSEPRLRPTTYAIGVIVGSIAGYILARGRRHPVYRSMSVRGDRF